MSKLSGIDSLNSRAVMNLSAQTALDFLAEFATDEDFIEKIAIAFGNSFNPEELEGLRQQWEIGDFATLPEIEIRHSADINGANGAFSKETNKIYLSAEYLLHNPVNSQAITDTLLEEIGHFLDAKINQVDNPGDEGAIFANLIQGIPLSQIELQALKTENDTATITLDGQTIQIEQNVDTLLTQVTDAASQILTALDDANTILDGVTSGVGEFLSIIQSAIDSQIFGSKLPLVGDELKNATDKAVKFLNDINDDILSQLGQLDDLVNLSSEKVRQALFEALDQLSVLQSGTTIADIPLSIADNLLNTVQTQLGTGEPVPDALRQALGEALTSLNALGVFAGNPPTIDDVLAKTLTEFSEELRGQLGGLLEEVLSQPLNLIRESLFQALGPGGLNLLPGLTSIEDIPQTIPKGILQSLVDASSGGALTGTMLRGALQEALGPVAQGGLGLLAEGETLADNVLEQILTELQTRLVTPISGLVSGLLEKPRQLIDQALDTALGQDIEVSGNADNFTFNLNPSATKSFSTSLASDIGLPGLSLSTSGTAMVDLNFGLDFGFGYNTTDGFFLNASAPEELNISLSAAADFAADGKLGFLQLNVEESPTDPTALNLGFSVDLNDPNNNGKLTVAEISAASFGDLVKAKANGAADVNLHLVTSFGTAVLPSISADFNLDWGFNNTQVDPSQPETFGDLPAVGFKNVKLNLGSFFDDFVSPIFGKVQDITGEFPIKQIVDVLQTRLPVLDDLGRSFLDVTGSITGGRDGKVTLLDIVKLTQPDAPVEFIGAVSSFAELVNKIPTDTGDLSIDLGGFDLGGADIRNSSFDLSDPTQAIPTNIESVNDIVTQLENLIASGNLEAVNAKNFFDDPASDTDVSSSTGLEFPILDDPIQAFKILLNQPVDLFKYNIPELGFNTGFSQFFPILGPLGAEIQGDLSAKIKLDFGFDTTGLIQFSGSGNAEDIFNGFYISTPPADMSEAGGFAPIAQLEAELNAYGALNAVIVSAGVGGGILGTLKIFLNDVIADGRVHLDEFDPACIFDPVTGSLTAGLNAFIKVGFGPFSYKKRFDIAKTTLLSFEVGCTGPDDPTQNFGLATDIGGGILRLNMGPNASDRVIGGVAGTDIDEFFTVQPTAGKAGSVDVSAFGITRTYTNVGRIVANGGNKDDTILLADGILIPGSLVGGEGNDQLYGGGSNDTLEGGANDDALFGSAGNDNLSGGDGDDFLEGGAGADALDGGNDDDTATYQNSPAGVSINLVTGVGTGGHAQGDRFQNIERIEGTSFKDVIIGNNANNSFEGFGGNDTLSGGKGNDFLLGGSGADRLDGGDGEDGTSYLTSPAEVFIDLETGLAFSGDADGDVLISVENVQGSSFNDFLSGSNAQNTLDGFWGDDTLDGSGGADILDGGAGIDWVTYFTSSAAVNISLKTGEGSGGNAAGDRLLFVKDQKDNPTVFNSIENLEGSVYNDILEGDPGANILVGLDGDDTLRGDSGNDTLIGNVGADNFDGGDSIDWADYSSSPDFVIVNLAAGIGSNSDAEGDSFVQISGKSTVENLLGSDFGDFLLGDDGDNEINPRLSNGAIDFVFGGNGNDRLIVDYSFNDIGAGIFGGYKYGYLIRDALGDKTNPIDQYPVGYSFQDEVVFSDMERLFITGTIKTDQLFGGPNDDILLPGAGDDIIYGGRGNDLIQAEDGNDFVVDQDVDGEFLDNPGNSFIYLDGGRGIDTLSVDLSGQVDAQENGFDIVLESTNPDQENPNQLLSLPNGSAIANFEVFKDINTGGGGDRLVQLGRVDNNFNTGAGTDTVNPGLGFDNVDGGSTNIIFGNSTADLVNLKAPSILDSGVNYIFFLENDLLIIDYSLGDTGSGMFMSGNSRRQSGQAYRYTSPNLESEPPLLDQVIFNNFERYQVVGTSQDDQIQTGDGNDTVNGGEGDDEITGDRGHDLLIGEDGNDFLQGTNNTNYGGSIFDDVIPPDFPKDLDTLTGGLGADIFVLGDSLSGYYRNAGNSDYALITDFNPAAGDIIQLENLKNCGSFYSLTASPSGLPSGTAIFVTDPGDEFPELIGIIQGATNLTITASYFNFVGNPCPIIE